MELSTGISILLLLAFSCVIVLCSQIAISSAKRADDLNEKVDKIYRKMTRR